MLLLFSHAADWSRLSVGKINNVYNLWSKLYRRAQYYNTSVYLVSRLSPYIIQPRCISHFINHYWKGETLSSWDPRPEICWDIIVIYKRNIRKTNEIMSAMIPNYKTNNNLILHSESKHKEISKVGCYPLWVIILIGVSDGSGLVWE